MKKYLVFWVFIFIPMTLFAQRKYPTGITPYTLLMMNTYADRGDVDKAESILSSLGYKYTSYKENFIGGTATYTRKTKDGYGSKIYWTIGTGLCHYFSVKFFTSKGSNYFINLLKKSKYKLCDGRWSQFGTSNLYDIGQDGREFSILTECA